VDDPTARTRPDTSSAPRQAKTVTLTLRMEMQW
jgi:hypothetical protein